MEGEPRDLALIKLRERAKELRCLYEVNELLKDEKLTLHEVFTRLLDIIPKGWQHTTICEAFITFEGNEYYPEDLVRTKWYQKADIIFDGKYAGEIRVYYLMNIDNKEEPFLPEEQKLLNSIAERISQHIFQIKLEKSLQYLKSSSHSFTADKLNNILQSNPDEYWKWRVIMAEQLADSLDMDFYGVKGIYLIGSSKNATAGPASDIDLLIHFTGTPEQEKLLKCWCQGWGQCLSVVNFQKTGYQTHGSLVDIHIITDKDIRQKSSYARMISAVDERARPLKVR